MLPILLFVAAAGVSAACLALILRLIDARVDDSIRDHVKAALSPTPEDDTFDIHVTQALNVVGSLPTQRSPLSERGRVVR